MNDDVAFRVILQRIDDMVLGVNGLKEAQSEYARDSRDTAVQLERVLGRVDELFRQSERQKKQEERLENMDHRLSVVENIQKAPIECEQDHHGERINKLEHHYSRFTTASIAAIVVINLMIYLAKELM